MRNKENILNTLKVIALAVVLAVGVQYVSAQTWTPPTSTPPAGNTYAPLNVGSTGQVKDGGLTLGFAAAAGTPALLVPTGWVGLGTPTPAVKLHLYGSGNQRLKIESTQGAANNAAARIDLKNADTSWQVQAYNNEFSIVDDLLGLKRLSIDKTNGTVTVAQQLRVSGGSPTAGSVLTATDSTGLATWQSGAGSLDIKSLVMNPRMTPSSTPTINYICNLNPNKQYMVQVYGATIDEPYDNFTTSVTVTGATTVTTSIKIDNDPDGTAPVTFPLVMTPGTGTGHCISVTGVVEATINGMVIIG